MSRRSYRPYQGKGTGELPLWLGVGLLLASLVYALLAPPPIQFLFLFPLAVGGFLLLYGIIGRCPERVRRVLHILLFALLAAGIVLFLVIEGILLASANGKMAGEPTVMVVLGAQVLPDGQPSVTLQGRLDTAYDHWQKNTEMTIVVSGGQGTDEPTTEAEAMANYLIDRGIPSEKILQEGRSRNTHQNLMYTLELLAQEGFDAGEDILVVSTDLHLARAELLWGRLAPADAVLSTLPAPILHDGARIQMFLREPFALVKSFLLDW